jgi:single-strand DNA-binding protein
MSSNVTLIGNITRDPELRYTAGGQAIATFGVAVNRRWQNRQTQAWEESTSFFDCVCWGDLGTNVADSLGKGDRVIISGRLEQRSWETQDGEKRSKIEVVADEVGPSVRWATARPEKTERRGPGQGGQQSYAGRGGGGAPEAAYAPAGAPAGGGFDSDEEPF